MNKKLGIIQFFILFSTLGFSKESEWKLKKEILLNGSSKYKKLYLDEEVYKYSNFGLKDLRIYNSKEIEIPYYLVKSVSAKYKVTNEYLVHKIDDYFEKTSRFIDFRIKKDENEDVVINSIKLNLPSDNFYINISVYGSHDGLRWDYLRDSSLYSVDGIHRNIIEFQKILKYKYYRFELKKNIELVNIDSIKVMYKTTVKDTYHFTRKHELEYDIETKEGKTKISFLNDNKLNFDMITIKSKGNFKRDYKIYSINKETGTKQTIKNGKIYRMDFQENLVEDSKIKFVSATSFYDKIVIEIDNKDNQAIDIEDVELEYHYDKLVFEAEADEKYTLQIGNSDLDYPRYDIRDFRKHIELEKQDLLKFGEAIINKESSDILAGINLKLVFNISLVLVSILLIWLIISSMGKKIK